MPYNANIHHRKSIRLKGYDYSQAGLYFITICCYDRIHRFGNIADGKMILNDAGKIATAEWEALKDRFHNIKQGAFVVMPNHIHFIIIITNPGMATARVAAKSTDYPIRARLAPDRKTDDGESVRAGLAPAYDGNGDIVRAELASAQIETDDREGRPNQYYGVGNDGDREGRPNESKYPENNPIGARLAPDRKTDDGESVRAELAPAHDGDGDIIRAELATALDGKDDREGRPDEYNGVGKESDREGRPNESKYPENNPIGARLAPDRKTDDGESVRAELAPAHDGDGESVRAGFTPVQNKTDDREGRPDEYNGVGKEGDRKGRPNESKYPENNPIGARLAPDRKTDDGESVRAELAPALDGDGDIIRAELASAQIETDDREGRPNQYYGVGNDGDREGRPNESKYPENNPIGARLAPDRKTDDGESVRAELAPAHDGDGDIIRAELAPALDGKDDREGRPDEYNGVGKESDRKGRPNESDRKITLGEIVGAYKSLVFNNCLKLAKDKGEYLGKFWQRDYYENIIRNDEAFIKISEYIINNPAKWQDDKFYNK